MRQFLGSNLEQVVKKDVVEVEDKGKIEVAGPLSKYFTNLLHERLAKKHKSDVITPTLESFTDPVVLAQHLLEQAKERRPNQNPLTVYAFDKTNLTDQQFVEASALGTQVDNVNDYYVVAVPALEPSMESINTTSNKRKLHSLEALVIKLGGRYAG